MITKPPDRLVFASLAELYGQFCDLLVGKEFACPRGTQIVIGREHFFHLTKLQKGEETRFYIETEEPLIRSITEGFGPYTINRKRAETLSWMPEIMREPDEIWEYTETKKNCRRSIHSRIRQARIAVPGGFASKRNRNSQTSNMHDSAQNRYQGTSQRKEIVAVRRKIKTATWGNQQMAVGNIFRGRGSNLPTDLVTRIRL